MSTKTGLPQGKKFLHLVEEINASDTGLVQEIRVSDIRPNPNQPRKIIDEETIKELAQSIEEVGLLQPILLRPIEGGHELVAGERRWRAFQLLEKATIPSIVKEMSSERSFESALIENVERDNLSMVEEAKAYQYLIDKKIVKNKAEIASRIGVSRARVTQKMNFLKLPAELQERMLTELNNKTVREITDRHITPLIKLDNKDDQMKLFDKMVDGNWSYWQVENQVEKILEQEERKPKKKRVKKIELKDLPGNTRIKIERGTITIKIDTKKQEEIVTVLKKILDLAESGELS